MSYKLDNSKFEPIAVIGVACLYPQSANIAQLWENILSGKNLITEVPRNYWLVEDHYDPDPRTPEKIYSRQGGFIPPVPFDPVEFRIPPQILPSTDSTQLLGLVVTKALVQDGFEGEMPAD